MPTDRTPALLPRGFQSPQTPAMLPGCWSSRDDEEARPGEGAAKHGTDPMDVPGKRIPARHSQAKQQGNPPKVGKLYGGKKGFTVGLGSPGLERLQPPSLSPTGLLQPPSLPKALLLLESPKERNEKVRQRQMQRTDKKYQGANRFGFFMPEIFAFLFLPWRHKPLLLSHNHLHCRCQEEFQHGEGDPFPRKSLYSGILALRGQSDDHPLSVPLTGRAWIKGNHLKGSPGGRGFPVGQGD